MTFKKCNFILVYIFFFYAKIILNLCCRVRDRHARRVRRNRGGSQAVGPPLLQSQVATQGLPFVLLLHSWTGKVTTTINNCSFNRYKIFRHPNNYYVGLNGTVSLHRTLVERVLLCFRFSLAQCLLCFLIHFQFDSVK